MSDDNVNLSRRKILGATAAVGVSGAAAGLGTSALFSDEESFTNNSITAGTLDMSVTAKIVAASEYYTEDGAGPDIISDMETADGDAVVGLQAQDVKPGDWVIICFDITIGDNPGYVQVSATDFAQYENGQTEPEIDAEGDDGDDAGSLGLPLDGPGEGELQDELVAEVYDSFDDVDSDDPADYVSGPNPGLSGSARTVFEQFATGVVIGGSATPTEVGADGIRRYLLLELPADVGNEVQSDAIEFDLTFEAVQVRNNDGFDPSSSLVGYWPLNSVDDGTAEDLSGSGNDGTVQGGVSPAGGQVADAGAFDGGYINIPYSSAFSLSEFTVALWFKTDGSGDSIEVLTNKQDESARYENRNWWLAVDNGHGFAGGNGQLALRTSSGGNLDVDVVADDDYRDDDWHRAVAVVDAAGGLAKLYVDDTLEDEQSDIGMPDVQTSPIQLGKEIGRADRSFGGVLDDIRVYGRAVSHSEL